MAEPAARRVNSYRNPNYRYQTYEDGSAVRRLDEPVEPRKQNGKGSAAGKHRRAVALERGYAIFLAVVCALSLFLCVVYLQQKATLTTLNEEIAVLESSYTTLKGDNDARYNQVVGSVTLEDIKEAATGRLGMKYAEADQIRYYTLSEDSYVRQYKEVTQAD